MMARGFKPVGWVAAIGGAALGCYMLSLNVAAERAELARVERQIVEAKKDIRFLQTELGTRGRLQQLEHWNAEVLALSAPTSAQYLEDAVTLARFEKVEPTVEERTRVQMASMDAPQPAAKPAPKLAPADYAAAAAIAAREPKPMVHQAAFVAPIAKLEVRKAAEMKPAESKPKVIKTSIAKDAKAAPEKKAEAAKKIADAVKPAPAKKLAAAATPAPAPKKAADKNTVPAKGMLDDGLIKELGAAAKTEKTSGGAGGR